MWKTSMQELLKMVRCPNCHSDNLQQQLNHFFFNCLKCGAWFQLERRTTLEYKKKGLIK